MITLRQLRYFRSLAAAGHFGRAADEAGVSQPALSMQLRQMEAELGGALVERTASGASLTRLGAEVAERAGDILAAVHDLEAFARQRRGVLSAPIHLGIIPSVAPYLLPRLLARLAAAHPELTVNVRETITATLVDEVISSELDAIIVSLPLDNDRLTEAAAFDDPFMLAAPAGSAHSARAPVLAELVDADELLLLEDGHCLREQALAVCHRIGPHRLRSFGATSLTTLLQLVANGHGVTLVPKLAIDATLQADPRVKLIHFAAPEPRRTIGLAWRRNSPRVADFKAFAAIVAASV